MRTLDEVRLISVDTYLAGLGAGHVREAGVVARSISIGCLMIASNTGTEKASLKIKLKLLLCLSL
jgi:hypothetical protein